MTEVPRDEVAAVRTNLRAAWVWATVVALLSLPAVVLADERTDARRHFVDGMELIESGDLDAGIEELQRAYDILPHPNVLYNIAQAMLQAGRLEEGIRYFERYLDSDPPDRAEVEPVVAEARARLAAERRASTPPPAAPVVPAAPRDAAAGSSLVVTDEELSALEQAAEQIDALARTAESPTLASRAERLRELASDLQNRRVSPADGAAPVTPPTDRAVSNPDGAEGPPEGSSEGLDLGGTREGATYEEQVVSSSRSAQSPLDAPNSTSVVTSQDLRLSGLWNPGETLRRVAGLELMTTSPGDPQISIRGLNKRLSNRAIVLLDGRSVYLDFIGTTLFSLLPVGIEDLQRIEVIRGPASALYGADAFTGVINLITRPIGEGGTYVTTSYGTGNQIRVAAGTNARLDRLRLRLSGGYERTDQFARIVGPDRVDVAPFADAADLGYDRLFFRGDGLIRLGDGYSLELGTGISADNRAFQGLSRLRELFLQDGLFAQSHIQLRTPVGFSARVFWNRFETEHGFTGITPGGITEAEIGQVRRSDVFDAELVYQNQFDLGSIRNFVIIGGGYRFKEVDWSWQEDFVTGAGAVQSQNHFNVFLQDTLRVDDVVQIVASARLDRHPLLSDPQISPRGSVLVHPTPRQTVRLTGGTAFRSPTYSESYINVVTATPLRGVSAFGLGNEELDPERIVSVELGYMLQESEYFTLELNGYFNLVLNQILLTSNTPYRLADFVNGADPLQQRAQYDASAGAFPLSELQFGNDPETFRQIGGEVALRVFPVRGLDIYANYAIHETAPQSGDASTQAPSPLRADQRTSTHKVNAGVQYRSSFGLDLSVDFSWVSAQRWVEQTIDTERGGVALLPFSLPSYAVLNARVGWRFFDDDLDIAVVGTNLVDDGHREHPFGQPVATRVMGTLTYRIR